MSSRSEELNTLRFDIFGRKRIEVFRHENGWLVYYCGNEGKRRRASDIVIPATVAEAELADYLADLFHEWPDAANHQINRW